MRGEGVSMKIDTARWDELSPFLDQAFELEGEARAAWVEQLRRERPELVADVQWVLGQLQTLDAQRFLQDDPTRSVLDPPSHEGRVLGNYTFECPLGRGGMGTVWLARRSDGHYEGKAAIKLLNLALLESRSERRFRREGRMLAKLAHPNIARILDAGVAPGGQPYLVLEYVEGEAIDRYCDSRGLTVDARITLFLDVLAAVGHAHANLIVHRDIKPSNLYVTDEGVPKLLDFGIAKLLRDDEERMTGGGNVTREGGRAFTPHYAAPEQLLGDAVSVATDVYALGVLLYMLLAGRHPTGAQNNSSTVHYFRALLESDPPRMSDAVISKGDGNDPATLDENAARRGVTPLRLKRILQGDLDNIVARALRKKPQERYATVREFADDLRRHLRNEAVTARPTSTWYRLRKFAIRNRLPVAVGAMALAAVFATTAIAITQAQRATIEAGRAAAERDRALALVSRSDAVADFLEVLITEAASSQKPVTVRDMLERSEALIAAEHRKSPETRAVVLTMLGGYYNDNGEFARSETLLRTALDAVRSSPDADLRRKITCDHAKMLAMSSGRIEEARRILNGVLADRDTTAKQAAECLGYLAHIAYQNDDGAGSLSYANQALARLRQDPNPSPVFEAQLLTAIADAQRAVGRNDLASRYFERALAQLSRAGRDEGATGIVLRNNWAVLVNWAGDPARALRLEDESVALLARREPGAPPPSYLIANRGLALEALGRYREALDAYSQCAEISARSGPVPTQIACLTGLGSVCREMGDIAAAETYYQQGAALARANAVPSIRQHALQILRGRIALSKGRYEEARQELDGALTAAAVPVAKVATLLPRAELNLREGQLDAAEADARQALFDAHVAQGGIPYSHRTGLASLMLGRVLAAEGEHDRAQQAFQDALTHLSQTVDEQHPMLKLARELARG
jgi:eukaryotic-like serine/threonine-protein kinase